MWKKVTNYEGLYEVSDEGEVRSLNYRKTNKIQNLKKFRHKSGYFQVILYKDKIPSIFRVHILVLEAFIGSRPLGLQGCHKDGNKANNFLSNLRWDNQSGNFMDDNSLEKHYASKLTNKNRLEIVSRYQKENITQKMLASIYGVGIMTISNLVNNRNNIIDRVKLKEAR